MKNALITILALILISFTVQAQKELNPNSQQLYYTHTQEFVIRSQNSEKTAKQGGRFRVRLNFQNVTQGTTSATYTAKWLWKP
jgi:hypothetical protein